jgi:Carboxypeptidase regulatory-like domain
MSTGKARMRRMIPALIGIAMFSFSALQLRGQNAATQSKTAAQPSGVITGRIVSESGDKISGAIAWAFPVGVIAQSRSTSVDSNGDFKLEGLAAGVYSVSCSLPGFVPAPQPSPDDARRYHHTGDSVTMTLIKGGVITGTVTTATNTPVVAAAVRAYHIRDANGQPDPGVSQPRERPTDDRGVYRFYGLPPGTYVVSVGGAGRFYGGISTSPYDNDIPTYAPSATRDTAMEIVVGSGEEITADIQYRGEPGQAISGTLAGLITQSGSQLSMGGATGTVTLTDVRSRTLLMSAPSSSLTNYGFAFYGVSDGEYEIVAQQYLQTRETLMSAPRRVIMRGADVTGINLSLAPLAAIAGRIVLQSNPPADCVKRRATAAQETVINARRLKPETKPAGKTAKAEPTAEIPLALANQAADGVPDAKGDFVFRNLQAGTYRFDSQLPGAGWYLKSITLGLQTTPTKAADPNIPRDGMNLRSGEQASGLTVTITEGAARLRGRVSVAEGQRVPTGLRVYLVPAEREVAENVLRFFEATVESDAGFAIGNVVPGRYWIVARAADDADPAKVKPLRQDSALRSQVAKEAEKARNEIQLQPCQRIVDYEIRYPPAATDARPNP